MSKRSDIYKGMVEDVLANWDLLSKEDRAELREMMARVEANLMVKLAAAEQQSEMLKHAIDQP